MANEQRAIAISTIPIPKLTVLMNNFICNTITHLNKLSVKGDEKLAEFDKKLNDLEVMTTLLEAKLNSLPEKITSTYPPLEETTLDDVTPIISNQIPISNTEDVSGSGGGVPEPHQAPVEPGANYPNLDDNKSGNVEQAGENGGEGEDVNPQQAYENFLNSHDNLINLSKMLKLGVPVPAVEQKAKIAGFDMDLVGQLIELATKAGVVH